MKFETSNGVFVQTVTNFFLVQHNELKDAQEDLGSLCCNISDSEKIVSCESYTMSRYAKALAYLTIMFADFNIIYDSFWFIPVVLI